MSRARVPWQVAVVATFLLSRPGGAGSGSGCILGSILNWSVGRFLSRSVLDSH